MLNQLLMVLERKEGKEGRKNASTRSIQGLSIKKTSSLAYQEETKI